MYTTHGAGYYGFVLFSVMAERRNDRPNESWRTLTLGGVFFLYFVSRLIPTDPSITIKIRSAIICRKN